jgi:hypothetical protein
MHKNVELPPIDYMLNQGAQGHVKIWQFNPESGDKKLLLEKKNLILKTGADVMASALAGLPNSKITHFYVGYTTSGTTPVAPSITAASTKANVFPTDSTHGYLRVPLAFPPGFLQESGYSGNVPYFTTFITNGSFTSSGAAFADGANLYTLGLVNAQNPSGSNQDRLFSAITFTPITYQVAHGLAITWGVTFRAV